MDSLSLVAPQLSVYDEELLRAVEFNLRIHHMGCHWGAATLLVGKGPKTEKEGLLREWLRKYRLNDHERLFLQELLDKGEVANDYFLGHFFLVQTYITHRLCSKRAKQEQSRVEPQLFAGTIAGQVEQHPLMQYRISISDRT